MQSAAWIGLLKRFPPAQQDSLMLLTTIGTEITIQAFLRLEEEYLVFRGRVAGTTDTGRVFFIPYDQINYLGFHKAVKEADVYALYGEEPPLAVPPPPVEEAVACAAPLPETSPVPAAAAEPASPPEPPAEKQPSKVVLLERLRARIAATIGKSAKS
jgi:hypothetical protein